MKNPNKAPVGRIIDANINRAKEGLRVCEEVSRFILESRSLSAGFKEIRHNIDAAVKALTDRRELLAQRDSIKDVGLKIYLRKEFRRSSYQDVFFANIQRVKESIRVLEEFSKLEYIKAAFAFKKIRYDVYEIEKKAAQRISHFKRIVPDR